MLFLCGRYGGGSLDVGEGKGVISFFEMGNDGEERVWGVLGGG